MTDRERRTHLDRPSTAPAAHARRPAATVLAIVMGLLLLGLPAPAVGAHETFVGPLLAYTGPGFDRVVVADLGAGTATSYDIPGFGIWSPDGTRLAVISLEDQDLRVIDVETGRTTLVATDIPFIAGGQFPPGFDWTSPEEIAVPVGDRLVGFDPDGAGELRTILQADGRIFGVDMAPDGAAFVAESCDEDDVCTVAVWETATAEVVDRINGDVGWDWSPDGQLLANSETGAEIELLDLATGEEERVFTAEAGQSVAAIAYDPDGGSLALTVVTEDGEFPILRTSTTDCCDAEPLDVEGQGPVRAFDHEGRYLAFSDPTAGFATAVSLVGGGMVDLPGGGGIAGRFSPAPAPAAPVVDDVVRLAGDERIQTAVEAAQELWPDGSAATATIVRADDFADAQTATPLAVHGKGPLLLSYADRLAPLTAQQLQMSVRPGSTVYLVGGTAVLSTAIEADIAALGFQPVRLGGADRFHTSRLVAREAASLLGGDPATVFIAEGYQYATGLISGNVAARTDGVVMLGIEGIRHARGVFPDARVIQVGDLDHDEAVNEVITAPTVYELAVRVATRYPAAGYGLASGEDFPDGLAGGAHAADRGRALLLTPRDQLPEPVDAFLGARSIAGLYVYGGTAAVAEATAQAALD